MKPPMTEHVVERKQWSLFWNQVISRQRQLHRGSPLALSEKSLANMTEKAGKV
jgi:hypothetical protein